MAKIAIALVVYFVALAYASPVYDVNEEAEIDLPGIIIPAIDSSVDDVNDDPKPCCLPKQWQGDVTAQSGFSPSRRGEDDDEDRRHGGGSRRGGFQQRTTTMFVDEDAKKIAGRTATRNDTAASVVIFYPNNTADLFLFLMGAQKCFHRTANKATFHTQCIPDNSTFGGTVNVGPKDKSFSVNIWNFHGRPHRNHTSNRGGAFVSGRALVTPDTPCIPVIFQNHGFISYRPGPHPRPHRSTTTTKKTNGLKFQSSDIEFTDDDDSQSELDEELVDDNPSRRRPGPRRGGGGFMGSSYFTNIEPKIADVKVFDVPDYCFKALKYGNTLQVGVDIEYPDLLDTFVSLE